MMKIIGLGHQSRVGKDTLAKALTYVPWYTVQLSFASHLKSLAHLVFQNYGVGSEQWYEEHPEDRAVILPGVGSDVVDLWITLGQWVRSFCPTYWIDAVREQIAHCTGAELVVISDVRFKNEAEAIKRWGGELWKVERIGQTPRASDFEIPESYTWDRIIYNQGEKGNLEGFGKNYTKRLLTSLGIEA